MHFYEALPGVMIAREIVFLRFDEEGGMPKTHRFIGRKVALQKLREIKALGAAKLVVLKGRRRIGKSRLLAEFGREFKKCIIFSGLPPASGVTAEKQRQEFAAQLERQLEVCWLKADHWSDLFWRLSEKVKSGQVLVVFDEITWMAQGDPTFLPQLKNAWDLYFKTNPELVLALCGSISAWIEENILKSTGFLGRLSLSMSLNELSVAECLEFWDERGKSISLHDKLLTISILGGVPRYLEEINPSLSVEYNISRLCFDRDGILFNEFESIFSDLFSKRSQLYKQIMTLLSYKSYEASELARALKMGLGGDVYTYLDELCLAGFISRDFTWHFKNGRISKLSQYRIKDNYSRFYLNYIQPNREKILSNAISSGTPAIFSMLPNWSSVMGYLFENMVLENRTLIRNALGVSPDLVICDGVYFQRKTAKSKGCQIDYLIQTRFNTLFVCEIKFTSNVIRKSVIEEVQEKISRLVKPKNFSCVPVLVHLGELHESVEEAGFFARIIDFERFFK